MSANETSLYYALEATRGVSPVGAYQELAFSGETLTASLQTTQSNLITADRLTRGLINVGIESGGAITSEMSQDTFDELLSGAFCADWDLTGPTVDVLSIGALDKTYTIFKRYGYLADVDKRHHQFQGMQVGNFNLTATYGETVGVEFTMAGQDVVFPTDAGTNAVATTLTPANPSNSMNACSDLANVNFGGVPLNSIVSSITMQIGNNLSSLSGLGQCTPQRQTKGFAEVTGTIEAFHDDASENFFRDAINSTENSFDFSLAGPTKTYTIKVPVFLSTTDSAQASGSNTTNTITLNYTAIRQSITIERTR